MRLRSDTVVLVFYRAFSEIAEALLSRFNRAGQHESQRMKQPHPSFPQPAFRGELYSLSDISH